MRIAFDIGGTFTDVIALSDDGHLIDRKVLSLLDDVGSDIVRTAKDLQGGTAQTIDRFIHATTICSNAVIENKAARAGLITTLGFRDTLVLRQQKGTSNPSIEWEPPRPLVPRSRTVEVDERILADGTVDSALDEASARRAIEHLLSCQVDAIAVCLINSYLNPAHERRLLNLISELAPGLPVCLSSDLQPEVREYERTSTTAINTSLLPVVDNYLSRLEGDLTPLSPRLLIMQSNGGVMTSLTARTRPVYMVESGPAAGALAAARIGARLGLDRVLSFDMGGTTAKACLITGGTPLERSAGELAAGQVVGHGHGAGYAIRVPMIDLVEVGAGGGSIAWSDGTLMHVGPHSAGAEPGPICYGRGGTLPTVTDANVVLGMMNPTELAGGSMRIDRDSAERALGAFGEPFGLSALEAADGIVRIATVTMMRALRAVSSERGHDPREFALVAFGGSGPLHAVALAESLDLRKVVVPPFPGVFSAFGLLLADYRFDYVSSRPTLLTELDSAAVRQQFAELAARALDDFAAQGIGGQDVRFERYVDLRYTFQVDDLTLPFPEDRLDAAGGDLAAYLFEEFKTAHEREYGYAGDGDIALVTVRLRALANDNRFDFNELVGMRAEQAPSNGAERRDVYFGKEHGLVSTPVHRRGDIRGVVPGPVIVEEPDTTVVVRPGWSVELGDAGELVISR